MKGIFTIGLFTILFAGVALAETYVWEDASGTVNFTEDLSRVPKKYRKKVRVRGDLSTPAPEESGKEKAQESPKNESPPPRAVDAGKPAPETEKKEVRYGGRSGLEWKSEFESARADLKATEGQIAELNGRLADTSKMSRADYLGILNSLKSLEYHKTEVGKKLDALNQSAIKAGVPAEYR